MAAVEQEQNVLVSVVLPVFNVENYLRDCLNSVVKQTYRNLEILCVNDASTDNSLEILIDYAKNDSRVQIFNNAVNSGAATSRNIGMDHAKGEYIYFLDADDSIKEDAIQKLVRLDLESLYFDSIVVPDTKGLGKQALRWELSSCEDKVIQGAELCSYMINAGGYTNSLCRAFYKRKFLLRIHWRLPDGMLSEDTESLKAILLAERCSVLNEILHIYRRHEGSLSTTSSPRKTISLMKHYVRLLQFWDSCHFNENIHNSLEKHYEKFLITVKQEYKKNKDHICEQDFSPGLERHLYNILLVQKYERSLLDLPVTVKNELKNHNYLIVYGAGRIGRDLVEKLQNNNIPVNYMAATEITTDSTAIPGIPLKRIGDLTQFRDSALVLIGTSKQFQAEIIENLKALGFLHYMAID